MVWNPHTSKTARDGPTVGFGVGEELLHPTEFSHTDAHELQVVGFGPEVNRYVRLVLMYKLVHNIILMEAITYVKLQQNL